MVSLPFHAYESVVEFVSSYDTSINLDELFLAV
jgi:hypothetical protein